MAIAAVLGFEKTHFNKKKIKLYELE